MNQVISQSNRSAATRAKWQEHIAAQRTSGLSQSTYCKANNLNAKYFSLWKSNLKKAEPAVTLSAASKCRLTLISATLPCSVTTAVSAKQQFVTDMLNTVLQQSAN